MNFAPTPIASVEIGTQAAGPAWHRENELAERRMRTANS
jgi:hypothetical protein